MFSCTAALFSWGLGRKVEALARSADSDSDMDVFDEEGEGESDGLCRKGCCH